MPSEKGDGKSVVNAQVVGYRSWVAEWVPEPIRLILSIVWFMVTAIVIICLSVFSFPRQQWRASLVKVWIGLFMPSVFLFYGMRIKILGAEHKGTFQKPVVYIINHSSSTDIITCSYCLSRGTVAIVKKQLLLYPIGWLSWIQGSVFINRHNREASIKSMKHLARTVREKGLSVCVFPEGTRSKDGRLQPFKKGAMHLAMQAKVPIVPVVISNAHKIWGKDGWGIKANADPITFKFLPSIDTRDWTAETLEQHIEDIRKLFIANLPSDQLPKMD